MSVLALILALITPCPTEDSTACYWDATAHGNGAGTSFVALADERIIYLKGERK